MGVNRVTQTNAAKRRRCPHARGGEPVAYREGEQDGVVVPTLVGVNRPGVGAGGRGDGVVPTLVGVNRFF